MEKTIKAYAEPTIDGVSYIYDFYDGNEPYATVRFDVIKDCIIVHPAIVTARPQQVKYFKKVMYGIGNAIAKDFKFDNFVFYTDNLKLVKVLSDKTNPVEQIGKVEQYNIFMQKV